ncbi:hypothetical protein CBS63078_6843 [Aspergillus niger]|nr:hypothetical protein CBS115989_619 [Aspergillus niger]KAI2835827.1 hypothetical protein CBS11232_10366 [Aspergillus niger]KAI2868961.1 hypothetical protein CBS115988_10347 [Aspergillus niger]KAI2886005.1 hypothetical protein CBS13152_7300 [Aspergillus niger]KAI2900867.1 hypothetical protein CBS63078_6843 [Aspergillus niger]
MDKQLLLTGSRSAITDRLPLTAYLIAWHFPLTFLFLCGLSCSSRSLNSRIASRRGKTGFRSTVINKNSQLRSSAAILL